MVDGHNFTIRPMYPGWIKRDCKVILRIRSRIEDADRERLLGLINGLSGYNSVLLNGFIMTQGRANKCALLYKAGFSYSLSGKSHVFFDKNRKRHLLFSAVAIAKKAVS